MRRAFIPCMAGMLLILAPAGPRASGTSDMRLDVPRDPTPGVSVSVFRMEREVGGLPPFHLTESLKYGGTRVAVPPRSGSAAGDFSPGVSSQPGRGKRTAIAIVSSAILPGLGELYLYFDSKDKSTLARVPVFIAIDGYLWYGYHHNHAKGKDIERNFRQYADKHWSLDRFLQNHPCCIVLDGCDSWQHFNNSCLDNPNYFFYTPREMDAQEYYENIGKYNAFAFGWDDAPEWNVNNPTEFEDYIYWPKRGHRETYWAMRGDSDKYLKRADQSLMLLIVNRVVSMVDAGWIAHRMSKGEDPDTGWSLRLRTYEEAPSLIISRRF